MMPLDYNEAPDLLQRGTEFCNRGGSPFSWPRTPGKCFSPSKGNLQKKGVFQHRELHWEDVSEIILYISGNAMLYLIVKKNLCLRVV